MMGALLWLVMFLGLSALTAFGAERASLPRVDGGPKPQQQLVPGLQLAQRLPFEPNKIEPIDPKTAFLEGYQAYKSHDLIGTIARMQLAAAQLPDLADYALYYLASAERDDGNSQAAADDFR